MRALIFNIQKFSLNDGPGIRTVVFFKGCPLRCAWCSNPESQACRKQILWDSSKCIGCGTCVSECPDKAISFLDQQIQFDRLKCTGCEICVSACSADSLNADSRFMTISEVLEVCRQDIPFYEESGGGITLSGGETLQQPDFSSRLLQEAKQEKISTAIETSAYASAETFDRVTKYADYLLADIKHWNSKRHKEKTGVSNTLILSNIERAVKNEKYVLPRIPIIPGFNDSLNDADQFCCIIKKLGLKRTQLLPFHQYGEKKYSMLGLTYAYENADALHEADLSAFQRRFSENDIEAFF